MRKEENVLCINLWKSCSIRVYRISLCAQFQFILIRCIKKLSWSDWFFRQSAASPSRNTVLQRVFRGTRDLSPFLRERSALVPDSRWRVDNWPIVARPPWTCVCIRRFARRGTRKGKGRRDRREGESRERVYRQGSPDPLASGPTKARDLIYEWDQTPEGGRRCRLAEPGTTLVPGPTNRRLVSPLSSRLFLPFALSSSFSFLLPAQLPISIPHLLLLPLLLFLLLLFLQFLPFLSFACPCCWRLSDPRSLLVSYSESTSRQLCVGDCPGIIAGKLGECCRRRDFFLSIKYIESW